jgi:hypothetical protein
MDDLTTTAVTVDAGRHPFVVAFGVVAQNESFREIHSIDSASTTVNGLTPVVGGGSAHLSGSASFGGSADQGGAGTAMTMLLPTTMHAAMAAAATPWAATIPATSTAQAQQVQAQQVRAQAVPAPSTKVNNLGGYARGIPPRGTPV